MIEILRKIFKANPGKTTIVLKSKCSDCGGETIVNITSTSGGFGLQGGALIKYSSDEYLVKCQDCYRVNPMIDDNYKKENTKASL